MGKKKHLERSNNGRIYRLNFKHWYNGISQSSQDILGLVSAHVSVPHKSCPETAAQTANMMFGHSTGDPQTWFTLKKH